MHAYQHQVRATSKFKWKTDIKKKLLKRMSVRTACTVLTHIHEHIKCAEVDFKMQLDVTNEAKRLFITLTIVANSK